MAEASPEVAYLAKLAIVEGHLIAARDLYRKGLVDEAVGLSWHPEAEMMDDVRADLAAHRVPDVTPAMAAFPPQGRQARRLIRSRLRWPGRGRPLPPRPRLPLAACLSGPMP